MKIIAYTYSDPLLESPPERDIWGWEIDRVYQDLGQREELNQLLLNCQQETIDYLLIRHLGELGDTVGEVGDRLSQLEAKGIEIIAIEQNYTSSQFANSPPQVWQQHLAQLLQEIQTTQRCNALKQGHARNRIRTLPPPGKAPYGYRRGQDKYIIDKSTAPVIKDFFERFLLFGSLRGAVRYLEKRYGKKIAPSTGLNWLKNPVYRGDLRYQNQEIIANTHAPIISREEGAQIDRLLRRNSRLPPRTASAPRSLAGLVICQRCQLSLSITKVSRRNKNKEYLYLRCNACPHQPKCKAIDYHQILQATIDHICLELPQAVAPFNKLNLETIKQKINQEINDKQKIRQQISSLIDQQILDRETAAIRNYKLSVEISQLERKLDQLPPVNLQAIAKTVSLKQFWLDLSETERRFYFREFIKQIEIIRTDDQQWDLQLVFIF